VSPRLVSRAKVKKRLPAMDVRATDAVAVRVEVAPAEAVADVAVVAAVAVDAVEDSPTVSVVAMAAK
jgi:hypothetical protein